jgi:hypothetical protein
VVTLDQGSSGREQAAPVLGVAELRVRLYALFFGWLALGGTAEGLVHHDPGAVVASTVVFGGTCAVFLRRALWPIVLPAMSDIGDTQFHKGQPVWVIEPDGGQRAAEYVGEGELSAWFGGAPTVFVVYADTREGGAVEVDRVIARDPDER